MKVLIVRFRALGDCVMTAWAATALRQSHGAELTWGVECSCAPIIATPELAEVHTFNRQHWKKHRWNPATWQDQIRTYLRLRDHKFDAGFDFQGHGKTALALRIAAPMHRFSMPGTDALTKRLNPQFVPLKVHQVDQNLELVSQFVAVERPRLPMMPDVPPPLGLGGKLITITTGAGHADKRIPIGVWDAVGAEFLARGFEVVYLGGSGDPEPTAAGAKNMVGKATITDAMGWIRHSALHIAGDTGTGHIASAYGVPVVSVFVSNRNLPERYQPYGEMIAVVNAIDSPQGPDPQAILSASDSLLAVQ
ncbi:MAG: glycosyltransferase family 9 protein [Chthonomonas sp.]|nr:glycosyltransferase family 9 protein [Chthonomonas sp.]